jgi:tRNA nucleotidyltransferase (CCA-adding enzyme)
LLAQGASLKLVKDFLVPLKEKQQVVLFHEILNLLGKRSIRGHLVQICYLELDDDAQGLGAVIEQVFEVENGEILSGFFLFRKKAKMLIIRRNNNAEVCLNDLLSGFGGGGHRQAASATVKTDQGRVLVERLIAYQEEMLQPAATAQMHVPVRNFMSRKMLCAGLDATVREIDEMLFENNIGHLPIVAEGRVVGIVTRADFLRFKLSDRRRKAELLQEMGLPLARSLSDLSVLD